MSRFFNTAGPIMGTDHYNIEPLNRFDLNEILSLIDQKKYFVIHAPRQTGKTSYLLALMEYLNRQGKYQCLYTNIESAQAARENVKEGMKSILSVMARAASLYLHDSFLKENWKQIYESEGEFIALNEALCQWCQASKTPIVLFMDEVDSLVGDTLISLLRQLRSGYTMRPAMFPQSIILCGVRDVRDYRLHTDNGKTIVTGGSAFNIKSESLRLGNFTPPEIEELYRQHTTETGQPFSNDVFPLVWDLTEGQPWLVNALAYEACFKMKEGQDREKEITVDLILQAKENLILRRETHLDQLADKLKEKRIRAVIEPILVGSKTAENLATDDVDYAVDLGLVKKEREIRIANRIYREVIPRELSYGTQLSIHEESLWYMKEDGRLDMEKLLGSFQGYFRENFESWVGGFDYKEAAPQLLLQAFLQRIVNHGGSVEREYGLGRQRTDLLLSWPFNHNQSLQHVVVELKIRYGNLVDTIGKGLEQTWEYMDRCGAEEGFLLVFDRSKKAWKDKIFKKEKTFKGYRIIVFGM